MNPPRTPLVVDLDRSLLRCDLLHDALAGLGIRSPVALVRLAWTHRGNLAAFKVAVAARSPIAAEDLPYNVEILNYVRSAADQGRRIILATASPQTWAQPIADHLDLFTDVLATSVHGNLKGSRKLAAIKQCVGGTDFVYVGDSSEDLPIFQQASERVLVGSSSPVFAALKKSGPAFTQLAPFSGKDWLNAIIRICRPHHWIKNLLIFLPALTSIGLYNADRLPWVALVVAAMCLVASAVYIINDLSDIAADRAHPEKKERPLAAGKLSVSTALLLAALLISGGLTLSAFAGLLPFAVLTVYLFINAIYTIRLKEFPLADVCALTLFYLLRVVLGMVVLGVSPSMWFLSFLACIFMELAIWKRYVEIIQSRAEKLSRRGYYQSDAGVLLAFGVGFSFCATLILGMYTQSDEISPLYRTPALLTLLAPILLIHNLGMWLDGSRGYTSGDPIMRVLHSRKSWVAGFVAAAVVALARICSL